VRALARFQARLLVVGICCTVSGVVAATGGAETPASVRQRADALQRQNMTLAQRMHQAVLDLYSIDSRLTSVREQLASLAAKRDRIARERHSVRLQLAISRDNLRSSQRRLAVVVRSLYEQQASDPLAVVLGATSLDEAIATLDDLGRTADQHQHIASRSKSARASLATLTHTLADQDARLRSIEATAAQTAASLIATQAARRSYISQLSEQRRLNDGQIAQLSARAEASVAASAAISAQTRPESSGSTAAAPAAPATPPSAAPDVTPAAHVLTVVATGYSMGGTTAAGLPVGWGTVAVDPSTIPLGTRMTIPGYGEGVAADTGSAIQGAAIDLWFPTTQQALSWGRRVVTIELH